MKTKSESGLIITSIVFIILLSFIGISLLTSTIFHIKILGARDNKNRESSFIKSNLIKYLHNFREDVYSTDLNQFEFVENEFFNMERFPNQIESTFTIKNVFDNKIRYAEKYRSVNINNTVTASIVNKKLSLESVVSIDILSGNIPISEIPLYLNKKTALSKESYLADNKINIPTTNFITKDDTGVQFELTDFLLDALNLDGKILNWKDIRKKAGVEISDIPLKNGIYSFISTETEDKLDALFIQGDVQKIVFSIENKKQKLIITHEDKEYLLVYEPDEYDLIWKNEFEEAVLFKEKIIINGNVYSLISDGEFAFLKETNIYLYSSGIVNIGSSLNSDSSVGCSLKIITGYNEFFNKPVNSGRVIINKKNDDSTLELSISIIALDKIVNNNKEIIINGSIYTDDLENKGIINFTPYFKEKTIGSFFTTEKFTFIKDFNVSFNGEVYDD